VQAAWNAAARSFDGEITAARRIGAARVIGAARMLGSAFDTGDTRFVLSAGGTLRLTRWIALAGDVASLLDANDAENAAWGAAVQIAIPYTPHSVSLQATNTNSATLHGTSRGADAIRWGFEFTVPIALGRYFGTRIVAAPPPSPPPLPDLDSLRVAVADSVTRVLQREYELRLSLDTQQRAAREDSLRVARDAALRRARADSARADSLRREAARARAARPGAAARDTVRTSIRNLAYAQSRIEVTAGTTIVWRNNDQVDHTVTATDGSWDSGIIRPGQSWQRTFDTVGTFEFFCTPHPFMKGTVTVRPSS
jgi:plastocyanin